MTEECYNILCDIEKDKKIEELQAEIEELNDSVTWWNNRFKAVERDNERLNNIIKEVRDYAAGDLRLYDNESIEFKISSELLEILDKENK